MCNMYGKHTGDLPQAASQSSRSVYCLRLLYAIELYYISHVYVVSNNGKELSIEDRRDALFREMWGMYWFLQRFL